MNNGEKKLEDWEIRLDSIVNTWRLSTEKDKVMFTLMQLRELRDLTKDNEVEDKKLSLKLEQIVRKRIADSNSPIGNKSIHAFTARPYAFVVARERVKGKIPDNFLEWGIDDFNLLLREVTKEQRGRYAANKARTLSVPRKLAFAYFSLKSPGYASQALMQKELRIDVYTAGNPISDFLNGLPNVAPELAMPILEAENSTEKFVPNENQNETKTHGASFRITEIPNKWGKEQRWMDAFLDLVKMRMAGIDVSLPEE